MNFSKKLKVDLSKTLMRGEVKRENEEVQKTVDDDRRLVIQVCLDKIFKGCYACANII